MIFRYSNQGASFGRIPGGGLGCLLGLAFILFAGYYIIKGLYYVLWWAAPALLVLTLIINWRVIPDTIRNWLKSLETNPLGGLINAALAFLAFPFFTLWLFLKALSYRKFQQASQGYTRERKAPQDDFVDFEELESRPLSEPPIPKAPESEPVERKAEEKPLKDKNPYDGFFGE